MRIVTQHLPERKRKKILYDLFLNDRLHTTAESS